jgi:hypothetical protein
MNRRHIGSSVGSSGEGVWALSCSLFENFTPSDEPTPKRLYTIGSSGAEEIFSFPQTHVQLLRRVIFSGHRTIRWWVSPGSSVAPTVRPTPIFFYRRFIRHYTKAWVLPVITVGGWPLLPTLSFHPPPPELVSSPYAVVYSPPVNLSRTRACAPPPLRRPSALVVGRPHRPSLPSPRAQGATPELGFPPPANSRPGDTAATRRCVSKGAQVSSCPPPPFQC